MSSRRRRRVSASAISSLASGSSVAQRSAGAATIGSGSPGNGHVYVPLARPVTLAQHRRLCEGLRDYLGGTDSKIVPSEMLRPPDTKNFKPTVDGRDPADVT